MSKKKMHSDFYYPDTGHKDGIVPYVGGKAGLIGHIVPIIDYAVRSYGLNEFHELCGGGGRMILHTSFPRLTKRVYNDIDTGIAALFYCCSNYEELYQLKKMLTQKGVSEGVFVEAKEKLERGILNENSYDMVTAAACAYITILQSEMSLQEVYRKGMKEQTYLKRVSRIHEFYSTLKGIHVTNDDVFNMKSESNLIKS